MKNKKIGIYEILNTETGTWYRGQSKNIDNRLRCHRNSLRRGAHHNDHLQSAWNKYGEETFMFTLLEECKEEDLNSREEWWIGDKHKLPGISYNKMVGGGYNTAYPKEMEELRSKAMRGTRNPFYGKRHSANTKKRISEARIGNPMPEEVKIKISKANKGKTRSKETKRRISEAKIGHTHSEATKIKISNSRKGKCVGAANCKARAIRVIYPNGSIKSYASISEAAVDLKVHNTTIHRWLVGGKSVYGRKHSAHLKGCTFQYEN